MHCVIDVAKIYPEWPLDLIDVLQLDYGVADTTVDTQDPILSSFVLNDGSKRHPFKQIVQLLEHTSRFIDILVEALGTLLTESKVSVDVSIFMVSS